MFDTKTEKQAQITVVFKLGLDEYEQAEAYIGGYKNRHYWAKKAFLEKVARMEVTDKKARKQRMITDAAYINDLIAEGLINLPKTNGGA